MSEAWKWGRLRGLNGHLWTIAGSVRRTLAQRAAPRGTAWQTELDDPTVGRLRLHGVLHVPSGARELVLLLHGLAGSAESGYVRGAATRAARRGLASLRLHLRGADGSGQDFYHAGLTADLHAALASPELRPFERLYGLGYSLGGHVALRLACEGHDPRLRAVAAVCSPLDLDATAASIDGPGAVLYRRYLLRHLRSLYAPVAARRLDLPRPAEVFRVRRLRAWDALTVAPRFGFSSAEDYYERASVGTVLDRLRCAALLVAGRWDPMVPVSTLSASLGRAPAGLTVRWAERGGHVAFPPRLDLGLGGDRGLENQVFNWLLAR